MNLHELTLGHGSTMLLTCTLLRHISVSATTPANSPHVLSPSSRPRPFEFGHYSI
jgi:hypothetical protein